MNFDDNKSKSSEYTSWCALFPALYFESLNTLTTSYNFSMDWCSMFISWKDTINNSKKKSIIDSPELYSYRGQGLPMTRWRHSNGYYIFSIPCWLVSRQQNHRFNYRGSDHSLAVPRSGTSPAPSLIIKRLQAIWMCGLMFLSIDFTVELCHNTFLFILSYI